MDPDIDGSIGTERWPAGTAPTFLNRTSSLIAVANTRLSPAIREILDVSVPEFDPVVEIVDAALFVGGLDRSIALNVGSTNPALLADSV